MMEPIYGSSSRISAVNYFCKKIPSKMFEKALDTPLVTINTKTRLWQKKTSYITSIVLCILPAH